MIGLVKPRIIMGIMSVIMAALVFITSMSVVSAAPPDDNCDSPDSVCDLGLEDASGTDNKCALCIDDSQATLNNELKTTEAYQFELKPNATVIYPSAGEVFYVDSALGYVDIPLRGRANNDTRMLSGNELSWFISDGVRITYAWAQGESTTARVYYRDEGCIDLIAVLHAVVLHNVVAYDFVGITVCQGNETL